MLHYVIRRLIENGEDHRLAVEELINRRFFEWAVDFLRQVTAAKRLSDDTGAADWYSSVFLAHGVEKENISAYGAIPIKMVSNVYRSTKYEVVVDAARRNHSAMQRTLEELAALQDVQQVGLSVRVGDAAAALTLEESMVVLNALAVKRAHIRGSSWASLGTRAEVPLMETLCALFSVSKQYWRIGEPDDARHQVDFMLQRHGVQYRCEVKLMGRGNPEGFKAALVNDARLLVADRLSDQAITTLGKNKVAWVALGKPNGYRRFGDVLDSFNIPRKEPRSLTQLNDILDDVLAEIDA